MASHVEQMWEITTQLYSSRNIHSDLVIEVERRKLYFYKQLLCLVSPVFERMLLSDFKEKQTHSISLVGKKLSHIVRLLAWIDPAFKWNLQENDAAILLPLADEYNIKLLLESCEKIILSVLPSSGGEKTLRYLQMGYKHNLANLQKAAKDRAAELRLQDLLSNKELYKSTDSSVVTEILEKQLERRESCQGYTFFLGRSVGKQWTVKRAAEVKIPSRYCKSTDLSDVTIIVGKKKLYFFSSVLRQVSPYFSSILDEMNGKFEISLDEHSEVSAVEIKDKEVKTSSDVVKDVESTSEEKDKASGHESKNNESDDEENTEYFNNVSLLLECLDPNTKRNIRSVKEALDLFCLSLKYDIPVLHEMCEAYLMKRDSSFNANELIYCILLADRGRCSDLLFSAIKISNEFNISELKRANYYKDLDADTRIKLLEFKAIN